ncbi:hypothetical protein [Falsiroseomonas sp.]|uniref:hypothetical protein n=1 Tax=Falsiroseomonas sp. TaxID=2870721 RepID=UPI00271BA767|nr:hypothetical protein [Falsiroseomonas sp.]MDO9501154.1 hypothetical protein [Falsiroseomonas sp.]
MQWHSGANPDKPEAEARLKQISRPHTLLSATEQRPPRPRGEIDASGAEHAPAGAGWRDHAEAAGGAHSRSHPGGFETLDAFGKV